MLFKIMMLGFERLKGIGEDLTFELVFMSVSVWVIDVRCYIVLYYYILYIIIYYILYIILYSSLPLLFLPSPIYLSPLLFPSSLPLPHLPLLSSHPNILLFLFLSPSDLSSVLSPFIQSIRVGTYITSFIFQTHLPHPK